MSTLAIRADGGPGIGAGHLARCLAIGQAWSDAGGAVVLASDRVPAWWLARYRDEGMTVVDVNGFDRASADWIVIDGYRLGIEEQRRAQAASARVMVVDDHATVGRYDADVILDPNLGASAEAYNLAARDPELLMGNLYVPLRRDFAPAARASSGDVRSSADRVLVALGGDPTPSTRAVVDRAVELLQDDGRDVQRLEGVADVVPAMRRADVALSAAGTTAWELCCLGVPALLVAVADNQRPVGEALERAGAAEYGGWLGDLTPQDIADRVRALLSSSDRRAALAARGRALVDGRGALRIVTRLRSFDVRVRRVEESDRRQVWEWANEPATRASSFTTDPIAWDDHVAWFDDKLRDPSVLFFIAVGRDDDPIGQVRFERRDGEAEISVGVVPTQRGKGLGGVVVAAGTRQAFRDWPALERIVGRIRPENRASIQAFDRAGYVPEAVGDAAKWVQYARTRHG